MYIHWSPVAFQYTAGRSLASISLWSSMSAIAVGVGLACNIEPAVLDSVHAVLHLSDRVRVMEPSLTPTFCTTSDAFLAVPPPLAPSNHQQCSRSTCGGHTFTSNRTRDDVQPPLDLLRPWPNGCRTASSQVNRCLMLAWFLPRTWCLRSW